MCAVMHQSTTTSDIHKYYLYLISYIRSYVFPQVQDAKGSLDMHIHFWLGKESSQVCHSLHHR